MSRIVLQSHITILTTIYKYSIFCTKLLPLPTRSGVKCAYLAAEAHNSICNKAAVEEQELKKLERMRSAEGMLSCRNRSFLRVILQMLTFCWILHGKGTNTGYMQSVVESSLTLVPKARGHNRWDPADRTALSLEQHGHMVLCKGDRSFHLMSKTCTHQRLFVGY